MKGMYKNMLTIYLLFILGFILVIKGGDWFVDSAVEIAKISGLPKIFIGATIVSVATTLPEVIVSLTAANQGHTTMAVGNAVGSMICNIGLILSITAIFGTVKANTKDFKAKVAILVACTAILFAFSYNGVITRLEAMFLLVLLVFYMYTNLMMLKKNSEMKAKSKNIVVNRKELGRTMFYFVLGISAIIAGSNLMINNGVIIAEHLGVPEAVISLTLIALGTSLPELVTGVSSLIKGNEDIGLGNIIGANILNAVLVIGASGTVTDLTIIPQNISLDLPIASLLTLILVIPAWIKKKVTKCQGIVMIIIYFAYIIYMWKTVL